MKTLSFVICIIVAQMLFAQTFTTTGSMSARRTNHEIVKLNNGNVLVMGGREGTLPMDLPATNACEIYSGSTWTSAASMNKARIGFKAMLLSNGKVLVIGGTDDLGTDYRSCEIYDPATNTWSYTDSLHYERVAFAAVTLSDGKILVAGNYWNDSTCEIYDPTTELWTVGPALNYERSNGVSLTLLPNGKVLLVGSNTNSNTAEIYDPASNNWTVTSSAPNGQRAYHGALLLNTGKVLLFGSAISSDYVTSELFDPAAGTFTSSGNMTFSFSEESYVLLSNGFVMATSMGDMFSFYDTKCIQVYNTANGTWSSPTFSLVYLSSAGRMVKLNNGKYLQVGGYNSTNNPNGLKTCWLISESPSGLDENETIDFSIYPNPCNNELMLSSDKNFDFIVSDAAGKTVFNGTSNNCNYQINTSNLSSGIYFLNISRDGILLMSKEFVKE